LFRSDYDTKKKTQFHVSRGKPVQTCSHRPRTNGGNAYFPVINFAAYCPGKAAQVALGGAVKHYTRHHHPGRYGRDVQDITFPVFLHHLIRKKLGKHGWSKNMKIQYLFN